VLLDSTFDPIGDGKYDLTDIHHTDTEHTIRVHIHRDPYRIQSYACIDVLTPGLTWTTLVTTPTVEWHHATPYQGANEDTLKWLADTLVSRAEHILACLPLPTPAPTLAPTLAPAPVTAPAPARGRSRSSRQPA
jgi:hypothetical protein